MPIALDENYLANEKIAPLSASAKILHLAGLLFCWKNLTDGRIDRENLDELAVMVLGPGAGGTAITEEVEILARVNLWEPTITGWDVHDYLKWNPTSEQVQMRRERLKERQDRYREARNGSGKDKGTTDTDELKRFFINEYEAVHGHPPMLSHGKDEKLLLSMLRVYGIERCKKAVAQYLRIRDDELVIKSGWSIGLFATKVNRAMNMVVGEERDARLWSAAAKPVAAPKPLPTAEQIAEAEAIRKRLRAKLGIKDGRPATT